jgi:3-deoxy-7-phosphoheptulonate synthase
MPTDAEGMGESPLDDILPGLSRCGVPIIAGPCAVESEEQFDRIVSALATRGVRYVRGGAFKHRTVPTSFRGLGAHGLQLMCQIGRARDVKIVSEIIDVRDVELFAELVDVIMIGARSMRNYPLIEEVATLGKPMILKRDLCGTVAEWLGAAEYASNAGAKSLILCERGVRWTDPAFRNLLDLGAVAWLKETTQFPILVDPSHATGIPAIIPRVSKAAMACGADALIIEVHDRPEEAQCDGPQALRLEEFDRLVVGLRQ